MNSTTKINPKRADRERARQSRSYAALEADGARFGRRQPRPDARRQGTRLAIVTAAVKEF